MRIPSAKSCTGAPGRERPTRHASRSTIATDDAPPAPILLASLATQSHAFRSDRQGRSRALGELIAGPWLRSASMRYFSFGPFRPPRPGRTIAYADHGVVEPSCRGGAGGRHADHP